MKTTLWVAGAAVAIALAGCTASFTDLSPSDRVMSVPDLGPTPDGVTTGDGAEAKVGPIARGTFIGLTGHFGEGTAELSRQANGSVQLKFSGGFRVSEVPGPVVLLSRRGMLGSAINVAGGDLRIGALQAVTGDQSYTVPGGDGGRRIAWVYCEPFRIEIARAELKAIK